MINHNNYYKLKHYPFVKREGEKTSDDIALCILSTFLISAVGKKVRMRENLNKWSESYSVVSDSLRPHGLYGTWNSPGQNTGVDSLSLLQGIFLTQGLNWDLLHCRQILYQLRYEGTSRENLAKAMISGWRGNWYNCQTSLAQGPQDV